MKLRFSESEIPTWADKYKCPQEESSLIEISENVRKVGYLTQDQLRFLARWKSPRSAGYVKKNHPDYVKEITSWAFSAREERSRIEALTLLDGVQWPTASAILHLFHTENYPILVYNQK